jgi:dihydropteroate synthase
MRQRSNILKLRERLKSFHNKANVGVLGILNVTPDSFFDGGQSFSVEKAIAKGMELKNEGAEIIDLGGQSSRPGAPSVGANEEWSRIEPVLHGILEKDPTALISIDTYRSEVAYKAIHAGAAMINDISAGSLDPELLNVVAEADVPYVLMHMRGRPDNMQHNPEYEDVVREVSDFFLKKTEELSGLGVKDIILDPGFGFGKRTADNYALLANLEAFTELGMPILVGTSRKSMICNVLNVAPSDALNGTTVTHTWALERGASLLRCHDVKEARQVVELHRHLCKSKMNQK